MHLHNQEDERIKRAMPPLTSISMTTSIAVGAGHDNDVDGRRPTRNPSGRLGPCREGPLLGGQAAKLTWPPA
jgi:hypothetical protein